MSESRVTKESTNTLRTRESGASWWRQSLERARWYYSESKAQIAAGGLGVFLLGASPGCAHFLEPWVPMTPGTASEASEEQEEGTVVEKDLVAIQAEQGWSFGAEQEPLDLESQSSSKFDRTKLKTLADDLTPKSAQLRPYYGPTLFQSVASESVPDGGEPLSAVIHPILTREMEYSYLQARAFNELFAEAEKGKAIVIDLPGPEAVAFAAALADRFEPVFLFHNWPHPLGVVPSHRTLAAVLHYRERFVKAAARRGENAPPVFVLDRNRLNTYTDGEDAFDNRYAARMPTADNLKTLGVNQIFYVVESPSVGESDDLNADLLDYEQAGLDTKTVSVTDFYPESLATPVVIEDEPLCMEEIDGVCVCTHVHGVYYYGGAPYYRTYFMANYGWVSHPDRGVRAPPQVSTAHTHRATPGPTIFANPSVSHKKATPNGFGKLSVVVGSRSGKIISTSAHANSAAGSHSFSGTSSHSSSRPASGHRSTPGRAGSSSRGGHSGRSGSIGRGGGHSS